MVSGQPSSLSEVPKGRAATEPSTRPPRGATVRNLIRKLITTPRSWLGKLSSLPGVRVVLVFFIGFAAAIAWQSYGNAGRQAIAGWSPHLAWLRPATAPATGSVSPEQFKAISRDLATARQSLDRLSTEISRMQVREVNAPRRRTTH